MSVKKTDAATGQPTAEVAAADAKRQTSRIPLEAALAADVEDKAAAGAPKTIRLKRPSQQPTVKTITPGKGAEPGATQAEKGALGKTARLDTSLDDSDVATPTRRKTIRVKRPKSVQGVKGISVARSEPEQESQAEAPQAPQAPRLQPPVRREVEVEETGWFSGLCAIAATVVAGVVIYMLLAQVCGPDASLTPLSYGARSLDLSWVGELPVD